MLEFRNVSFSYEAGIPVIDALSFSIHKGESVGLIGANGAGQSTIMKLMLGLLQGEGQIFVDSLPVEKKNLPVIVSEFSICDASGNGAINKKEAKKWMSLLKKYNIGRIAWSLCNKNETSALLKPSCKTTANIKKSHLSKTGKWIVKNW